MASAGGIKAGRAYVEISADDSQFQRALGNVQKMMASTAKTIATAGAGISAAAAAMAAPLLLSVKSFEATGSALNDMAARTGLSVENLSELGYVAQQTGASMEEVEIGFRKAQKAIGEATLGSEEASAALAKIGLSAAKLKDLKPDQQLQAIAEKLATIKDPTTRAAAAMEIFGKSGTKLLPLISELDTLREKSRALNAGMTSEQATMADAMGDAFNDVRKAIGGVMNSIGSALAPTLTDLAEQIAFAIAPFTEWIGKNRELVVAVAAGVAGLGAAGVAVTGLGGLMAAASVAVGGLATGVGVVGAALGAILSPVGIAIGAIAGLGGAILYYTAAGSAALSILADSFGPLVTTATDAIAGITNALAKGDINGAVAVLWTGVQAIWQQGTQGIRETWIEAWAVVQKTYANAKAFLLSGFAEIENWAFNNFPNATAFIEKTWTDLWSNISAIFTRVSSWLTDRFIEFLSLFDDSIDVKASKQLNAEDLKANLGNIESNRDAAAAEIRRKQTLTPEQRAAELQASLAKIESDRVAALNDADAEKVKSLADAAEKTRTALDEFRKSVASASSMGNGPGGRLSTEADAFADGKTKTPFVGDPAQAPDKVKRAIDDAIKFASPVSSFASLRGSTAGDGKLLSIADRQLSELKGLRRDVRDINTGVNVT